MKEYPHVLQVNSLAEFQVEIPLPSRLPGSPVEPRAPVVRLNLTEMFWHKSGGIPQKLVGLDLQGVNDRGEIVWLHYGQQVLWIPSGPLSGRDASIYEGMSTMRDLVRAYLVGLGYQVRGGRYGIPDAIKPLRGCFECARWEKDGDEVYTVVAVNDDAQGVGET
jgi:hypothetical protein